MLDYLYHAIKISLLIQLLMTTSIPLKVIKAVPESENNKLILG